jgi:hypothetical protein
MRSILILFSLSFLSISAIAQRGGRLGMVYGVAKTSMQNKDDLAVDKKILQLLPTAGSQYGVEAGYAWRYFGVSMQIMRNHYGQAYLRDNYLTARTRLTYTRPSFILNFNSNPAKDVRICGYFGAGYGTLNKYKDVANYHNPATGAITTAEYANSNFTISDTNTVGGYLSSGIYYKSDVTAFGALGTEVRIDKRWLCNLMLRTDYGIEKLENYNKTKRTFVNGTATTTSDYEHWRYSTSKFERDVNYSTIRTASNNFAFGLYFGFKYIIPSKAILDYEIDGF